MMKRPVASRAQAFDAAGASGMAFLMSQLELIDTDLVRPLQAVTHKRDIAVEVGGGFPEFISAFASNYATTGTRFFGLQGTNNTDVPEAQADIQKGFWRTYIWAMGITITWIDLKRMEFSLRTGQAPPFSLQELYEESVETNWGKALDYVTYNGFLGDAGLVNNTNVFSYTAAATGSGGLTTWTSKTPQQILADVNIALNQTVMNSGYDAQEGMADRMLVPYTQFAYLTQPMAVGSTPLAVSTLSYIEKECVAAHHGVPFKINFLPNDWISGKGAAGSDRAVVYKNSKKSLYLKVPNPFQQAMTVPTTRAGGAYETLYVGCVSQIIYKRTQTQVYVDGI
jgi:hypothetical protein